MVVHQEVHGAEDGDELGMLLIPHWFQLSDHVCLAGGWMKGRWGGNRERTGVAFSGKLYDSHQMLID